MQLQSQLTKGSFVQTQKSIVSHKKSRYSSANQCSKDTSLVISAWKYVMSWRNPAWLQWSIHLLIWQHAWSITFIYVPITAKLKITLVHATPTSSAWRAGDKIISTFIIFFTSYEKKNWLMVSYLMLLSVLIAILLDNVLILCEEFGC